MNSISFTILLASAALVNGHGMVLEPPGRASAWRFNKWGTPINYDDNGLNCGGRETQWKVNKGKCGLCGDAYNEPTPRRYEFNGKDYRGAIVAKYLPGSTIQITTQLTASHMGYWEFKLCTDHTSNNQECFDKNVLELQNGGTKYYPNNGSTVYKVNYKLPPGVTCEHCVLQWTYRAGNDWGWCGDGTGRLGCGPQETFRGCSDIAILR